MVRTLVVAAALLSWTSFAEPVTYRIDPERSEVVALTRPAGLGSALAHPHVIETRELEGRIVHDPELPDRSSIEISAPTSRLVNDDPEARARYGLKGTLSEDDRKDVARSMQAPDQLDVAKFPTLSFRSTAVRSLPDGRLELTGLLSIRGVSREVKLPVQVKVAEGTLRGEGAIEITHAQFGFRPFSMFLGLVANAQEVQLRVMLVASALTQ